MKMIKIITLTLLLCTVSSFAQKVKKAKRKSNYGVEKYYVLKSDLKTKHGEFKEVSYTPPFRKLELGHYANGKKVGEWIKWYDKKGKIIKSIGKYKDDGRIGIWSFFYSNGKLIQKYDYDNKNIVSSSECDNKEKIYIIKDGEKTIESTLDCPPTRIGGIGILIQELLNEIMNKSPFKVNEFGRTTIKVNEKLKFNVTEKGTIENILFTGKEENEELFEVIEQFITKKTHKWIAGTLNDEKVNAEIVIPIRIHIMY